MTAMLPTDTYALIERAIRERKIVRATYRGGERLLCPHVLGTKFGKPIGRTTRDRKQVLSYQFGGYSASGIKPHGDKGNWRCLFLDELSGVTVEAGDWHTAPNYTRPNNCVDEVDVEVDG